MVGIPGLVLAAVTLCGASTIIADSVIMRVSRRRRVAAAAINVWTETRAFLLVALSVFTISVFAQLVFIRMMHPSLTDFFVVHKRTEMFLMTTSINLVNGLIAGYLASRIKSREHHWRTRQQEMTGYLNHHVRNAMCSIQYAALCTKNEQAIDTCNESVRRIVDALKTAENGIPQTDEFRQFQQKLKVS
jgi:hypothetical protein